MSEELIGPLQHQFLQQSLADTIDSLRAQVVELRKQLEHPPLCEMHRKDWQKLERERDEARQALDAFDAWAIAGNYITSSFCEFCVTHAPKDEEGGLTGPIAHKLDCPVELTRRALAQQGEGR